MVTALFEAIIKVLISLTRLSKTVHQLLLEMSRHVAGQVDSDVTV